MDLEDIEAKLIDIESEIADRASEHDVSELADKISDLEGEISSMSDSIESLFLLALCVIGCFFGWKRVIQAMFIFIACDLLSNGGSLEWSEKTAQLLVVLIVLGGLRWVGSKVLTRLRRKKPVPIEADEAPAHAPSSRVERILAKTGR